MERAHAEGTKFIVDQIDAFPKSSLAILDLGCGVGWTFDKFLMGIKKQNYILGLLVVKKYWITMA